MEPIGIWVGQPERHVGSFIPPVEISYFGCNPGSRLYGRYDRVAPSEIVLHDFDAAFLDINSDNDHLAGGENYFLFLLFYHPEPLYRHVLFQSDKIQSLLHQLFLISHGFGGFSLDSFPFLFSFNFKKLALFFRNSDSLPLFYLAAARSQ